MSDTARKLLAANMTALGALVEQYPSYVPVLAVAELLHIKPEALRASIEQGRCPFGFCWRLGEKYAYKISTLALCSWLLGTPAA